MQSPRPQKKNALLKKPKIAMKCVAIDKPAFDAISDKEILARAVEGIASDQKAKLKMSVECVTSRAYDRTVALLKHSGRKKKAITKVARKAYAVAKKASVLIRIYKYMFLARCINSVAIVLVSRYVSLTNICSMFLCMRL